MKVISKIFRVFSNILLSVTGVMILFSTILATVNAILRYFANAPVAWADELSVYLIIIPVFLAMPALEYSNGQLCIDAVIDRVKSDTGRRIFVIVRGLITMAVSGLFSYLGVKAVTQSIKRAVVTPVLLIPKGGIYAIVTACFIASVIAWVVIILRKGKFDKC